MDVGRELRRLNRRIDELLEEQKRLREMVADVIPVSDVPDNTDMTVDEVKKLIMDVCERGEKYYPAELAVDHGLDYDTVLKAVESLQKTGHVKC